MESSLPAAPPTVAILPEHRLPHLCRSTSRRLSEPSWPIIFPMAPPTVTPLITGMPTTSPRPPSSPDLLNVLPVSLHLAVEHHPCPIIFLRHSFLYQSHSSPSPPATAHPPLGRDASSPTISIASPDSLMITPSSPGHRPPATFAAILPECRFPHLHWSTSHGHPLPSTPLPTSALLHPSLISPTTSHHCLFTSHDRVTGHHHHHPP